MENNRTWIVLGVMIVSFIGLVAYQKITAPQLPQSNGSNNVYGKVDSPVTLTEYVDFQCEGCYAFYPTVKEVKEKYQDKVKFQIKYFPIANSHQYARLATGYAEAAARQGKFFEMHDKIFEGQKIWETATKPQEYFDGYANEIGLDMSKLKSDRENPDIAATINADLEEVKKLGGTGTPTFALNGKMIETPENSTEAFYTLLDKALGEAKK